MMGPVVMLFAVGLMITGAILHVNDTLKYISARLEDIDNGIRRSEGLQ